MSTINKTELADRGWTESVIRDLLGEPDGRLDKRGKHGSYVEYAYDLDRVQAIEATAAWQSNRYVRARLARLSCNDEARAVFDIFRAIKLLPSWVDARIARIESDAGAAEVARALAGPTTLEQVCTLMTHLNRYAKTAYFKDNIYAAKEDLIAHLIAAGHLVSIVPHIQRLDEKYCFSCDGTGDNGYGDDYCPRCDGTGVYLPARDVRLYLLTFAVDGVTYSFHQPAEKVSADLVAQAYGPAQIWESRSPRPHGITGGTCDPALKAVREYLRTATRATEVAA